MNSFLFFELVLDISLCFLGFFSITHLLLVMLYFNKYVGGMTGGRKLTFVVEMELKYIICKTTINNFVSHYFKSYFKYQVFQNKI